MTATAVVTYFDTVSSPLGDILLTSDGEFLTGLHLGGRPATDAVHDRAALKEAAAQLRAYLAGELTAFDLPLRQPGTAFQQRVWAELMNIPYGATISYAELAKRVGQPTAARAVGSANGRNQIAVIVPCHRVIAAGGGLGGYGGELWRKEWLLQLESGRRG
jgi:methylated-DNA-[protein]-cysteine S-methyltransferase